MKKKYMIPSTTTIEVQTSKMIAGSLTIDEGGGSGSVYETPLDPGDEVLSRNLFDGWVDF